MSGAATAADGPGHPFRAGRTLEPRTLEPRTLEPRTLEPRAVDAGLVVAALADAWAFSETGAWAAAAPGAVAALALLDTLIADSGLEVTLTGEVPRDASPAVERAAYRTVQEALTNVRKHAPGSAVVVDFRRTGPALDVTVTNTTARHPALGLPSARHGLLGLRERAEHLGGALSHGPTPDGGYRLHL
ncbi:sensor histidine kinase [Streptomyces sp. NPDC058412]|uniref:sensor histidine kinase n=1 Tax=Streptomyces sp. NPDC058412 TaxID=3346486 RepID=UPI003659322F